MIVLIRADSVDILSHIDAEEEASDFGVHGLNPLGAVFLGPSHGTRFQSDAFQGVPYGRFSARGEARPRAAGHEPGCSSQPTISALRWQSQTGAARHCQGLRTVFKFSE
jgi:hypothetical protein